MITKAEFVADVMSNVYRDTMLDLGKTARDAARSYWFARFTGKSKETRRYYLAQAAAYTHAYNAIRSLRRPNTVFRTVTLRGMLRVVMNGE